MLSNPVMRIGTRGSRLALRQAELVKEQLLLRHSNLEVALVPLRTSGDVIRDRPLASIGGKGLFVKEIEKALWRCGVIMTFHCRRGAVNGTPAWTFSLRISQREDPR